MRERSDTSAVAHQASGHAFPDRYRPRANEFILIEMALGALSVHAQPFAYVSTGTKQSVVVVDTSTNTVVDSIECAASTTSIAPSPDGSTGYVVQGTGTSVFSTSSNEVVDVIATGASELSAVAVSSSGEELYLADRAGSAVIELDATSHSTLGRPEVYRPEHLVSDMLTDRSFAVTGHGWLARLSPGNSRADLRLTTDGVVARCGAVSPDGSTLYVGLAGTLPSIAMINVDSFVLRRERHLERDCCRTQGVKPAGMSVTADGTRLFITNDGTWQYVDSDAGTVHFQLVVHDTTSNGVSAVIPVDCPTRTSAIARHPNGDMYVTCWSGKVFAVDPIRTVWSRRSMSGIPPLTSPLDPSRPQLQRRLPPSSRRQHGRQRQRARTRPRLPRR